MNAPPEILLVARALLGRARADLLAVRALAEGVEGVEEVAGFHAQQAAEKALKAAMLFAGEEPPRTHDLLFLADFVASRGMNAPISADEAASLYPYAVEFRYEEAPDGGLPVSEMLAIAERTVTWAETLSLGGGSPST